MKKAAIIVLNYNGAHLLKQHLPAVVRAAKVARIQTKVVVADNGSSDTSEKVVKAVGGVEWMHFSHNLGFGQGNNKAVKQVDADIVVLLNSDIDPDPNFLNPLYEAFEDEAVFAASSRQEVKTRSNSYFSGGSVGEWQRGLLRHRPIEEVYGPQLHPTKTFYADAGAAAYDRRKFLALNGFSPVFPFYWEDADLSFRAWKHGWTSLFVPESQVTHYHESTISKVVSQKDKKALGWRGIWLFTWRGIDQPSMLLSHLMWLPFHIGFAMVTGRLYRLKGLWMALPNISQRIFDRSSKKSTKMIIATARPEKATLL